MAHRMLLLYLLIFPILAYAGINTADSSAVEQDSLLANLQVYEVFGMDCPGCHGGVEKLVKKIPAVLKAEANWEKQQLKVWIAPGQTVKDAVIHDAIERANFTPGKRIQ